MLQKFCKCFYSNLTHKNLSQKTNFEFFFYFHAKEIKIV